MRLVPWLALALPLSSLAAGCDGPKDPDEDDDAGLNLESDADTDADTDADIDADVDADTDADTDADPPATFEGTVTLTRQMGGVPDCDVTYALSGTEYVGPCEDCEFAFRIEPTITADNSTAADCYDYWHLTYDYSNPYYQFIMAYSPAYLYYFDGYPYTVQSLFMTGWAYAITYNGSYYFYGPYWTQPGFIAYNGPFSNGTFTRKGDAISWTYDNTYTVPVYNPNYAINFCGLAYYSYANGTYASFGDAFQAEDVSCADDTLDVWTFESDGGPVAITVDTLGSATAFDPQFWVNDSTTCVVGTADESYDCTYPGPSGYRCPSIELNTDGGLYEIVVKSYVNATYGFDGDCATPSLGEYELAIGQDEDPNLTLVIDDGLRYNQVEAGLSAVGSGTITDPTP